MRCLREVTNVCRVLLLLIVTTTLSPLSAQPRAAAEPSPVQRLGYTIYQQDRAAWIATDAALQAGLAETPAKGWITLVSESQWLVRFVGDCAAATCSYLDVEVLPDGTTRVTKPDAPRPVSETETGAWRARELALSSPFRRCTDNYNTVILPTSYGGERAWSVYLLAATKDSSQVVLNGHHRVTVSLDGKTILKSEPLFKTCLLAKAEQDTAAYIITDAVDLEPIETQVFTSLLYQKPLYVRTKKGTFSVDGVNIAQVDGPGESGADSQP
jgi:hypothetical protein